jgi:hypothetical protein
MANSKITDLTELTSVDNADVLVIVDSSVSETKKISFANLSSGISVGNATELQFTALNSTGATITKGSPVYVSGHTTETQVADADNSSASTMPAFGIAKDDIANGATGTIVIAGEITGINTSSFTVGDELYVGTGGALTATKPTGTALIQKVAKVTKAAASGEILVTGAGRVNDVPNIAEGYIWEGNASGVATAIQGPGRTNGQLLIGGTSGAAAATLSAGSFVKITNGDGTITIGAGDGTEVEYIIKSSAVSAAGEVEGSIVKFGSTTGLTAGSVYVWNGTDWVAVDADAEATTKGLMGVALGTSAATGFLTHGTAYLSHDPGTAGDILYVDTVTAGYLTSTQPSATGDFVRVAGYCLADNKVFFSPSQDWIEIA